jgi:hypothetical protein
MQAFLCATCRIRSATDIGQPPGKYIQIIHLINTYAQIYAPDNLHKFSRWVANGLQKYSMGAITGIFKKICI